MKKGWKRILAFILTVALVLTLLPYSQGKRQEVKAQNTVNVSTEADLDSISATADDILINLQNNIEVSHTIEHSSGNLAISMNGFTISGMEGQSMTSVLHVSGGSVVIYPPNDGGEGKIVAPDGATCIRVEKDAHVIAQSGEYTAQNGSPAIAVYKDTGTYKDFDKYFLPPQGDMMFLLSDYSCAPIGNYMWSASNVKVVHGKTMKFNTLRSEIESYIFTDTEAPEAKAQDFADNYSCPPLTVSFEGNTKNIYQDYLPNPAANESKLKAGIDSATFLGWSCEGSIITTTGEALEKFKEYNNIYGGSPNIYATWAANVSTGEGFKTALKLGCVKKITLDADITLDERCVMESKMEIDLNGHTINYAGSDTLLDLYGEQKIMDSVGMGGIHCTGGAACIATRSDLTIDGGFYRTNGPVAVKTIGTMSNRNLLLKSGKFLSTAIDGHGLMISTDANYEPYIGLLSNTMKTNIVVDNQEYICFAKNLIITKDTDRKYEIDTKDIALQNMTYGDQTQNIKKISITNTGNSDINISRITIADDGTADRPFFTLEGVQAGQLQPGIAVASGDTDESVGIRVNPNVNVPAGEHKGIITLYYQSQCDPGVTYSKTVEVTVLVNKRKIVMDDPVISLEKVYDKTTTAMVTAGVLKNLVGNDIVSVTAHASYNSAEVGNNKAITLVYTMSGEDSANYIIPDNKSYQNGKITKAAGEASIVVLDYNVGEKIQLQPASKTNGIRNVTCFYKEQGAPDATYTKTIPEKVGKYTVKAVFAAVANYTEVNATANFAIKQLPTPAVPYTILGTSGRNGWYSGSVVIQPPLGYTISTNLNGSFTSNLVVDASAAPVVYLKSNTGAVTAPITVAPIRIDTSAPSVNGQGEGITIGAQAWNSLADLLNYNLFYKDRQEVVIHASDAESQIASYQYLVSATQMTQEELIKSTAWKDGQSFSIESQTVQQSVIYAKITNGAGLVSYISSDGLIFDTQAPVITGAVDGETYYGDALTVKVADDYLDSVTINGITQKMTDKETSFILTADENQSYQITATDKSGNRSEMTVSVKQAWLRDGISSEGKKTLATGVPYKLGGGKWSVSGDSTVYEGNSTFYATASGDYEFLQK